MSKLLKVVQVRAAPCGEHSVLDSNLSFYYSASASLVRTLCELGSYCIHLLSLS